MGCTDLCLQYKFTRPNGTKEWYGAGGSRCDRCDIFITWDGIYCPCCGLRLRKTPRTKNGKGIQFKNNKHRI